MRVVKFSIAAALLFFAFAGAYLSYSLSSVSSVEAVKEISIASGSGLDDIATLLEAEDIIRSKGAFKIWSFFSGSAHLLKPGDYSFASDLGAPEIISELVAGPPDLEVLVTEGKSMLDIEADLSSRGLISPGELSDFDLARFKADYPFLGEAKTLEGFLFPDTYRFSSGASAESVIRKFLDAFRKKALPIFYANKTTDVLRYDDLIIASLIEREVPFPEDRPVVSGILKKRLSIGMPLQVDATVLYVACGYRYEACRPLTEKDFRVKSFYNTYLNKGLPPAPIANPGSEAIKAALNPVSSGFFYYLSDPKTKKTVFSRTLEEHARNKAIYLSEK